MVTKVKKTLEVLRLNETVIKPLSGRGKDILYINRNNGKDVIWGQTHFFISNELITQILNNYLVDPSRWYPLGADMTRPISGGLGEYINNLCSSFSPRHATAIAAIMHNEKLIAFKNAKPILLKRMC
jgi:hypothetical protein